MSSVCLRCYRYPLEASLSTHSSGHGDVNKKKKKQCLWWRTLIDTTNVEGSRWELPLVDRGSHAICEAIHKSVERAQRENMYFKYVELHKSGQLKKAGVSKKAQALLLMRDAKANGEAHYEQRASESLSATSAVGGAHEKSDSRARRRSLETNRRRSKKGSVLRRGRKRNVNALPH